MRQLRIIYQIARYCWHKFYIRNIYISLHAIFHKNFLFRYHYLFYQNILLFKLYRIRLHGVTRPFADSPPGTQNLHNTLSESSNNIPLIDFDKIKPIAGISLRHYEKGAFRIQNMLSKEKIGVSPHRASWLRDTHLNHIDNKSITNHASCCLAIPQISGESFALQLFHIFTCFLYLRNLKQQSYEVECLLLDNQNKSNDLYTACLPNYHFPEEFTGIHRFQHIIFSDRQHRWPMNFRDILYNSDLSEDFHQFVLSAVDIASPPPTKCVKNITVIRRKKYTTSGHKPCIDRVIKNEDEIIKELNNHYPKITIKTPYLEELPLKEQLKLFTCSDILISMHGAGLIAGSYFVPQNASIVELFPKYYRIGESALTCRSIASERKLHYMYWLNHRRANEFGSEMQAGVPLHDRYSRTPIRHASLTHVPPKVIIKRVDKLIRKIEMTS